MLQRSLIGLITATTFLVADVAVAAPDAEAAPESVLSGESSATAADETVRVTSTESSETADPQLADPQLAETYEQEAYAQDPAEAVVYAPQPPQEPQPPPPVYQPRKRRGLGLMISGFSLFAASYGLTALSGALVIDTCKSSDNYDCRKLGGSLLIPVVGPFLATSEVQSMSGRVALVFFPGLAQVAGLSMGIAGSVLFSRSRRRYATAFNSDGVRLTRKAENLRVSNMASPFGGGMRLTYRF